MIFITALIKGIKYTHHLHLAFIICSLKILPNQLHSIDFKLLCILCFTNSF